MKARKDTAEWIVGLRSTLRGSIGSAWRVSEHRSKAKLDIRFDDGSRRYKTLPIPWDKAHARRIQETVESLHREVDKGRSLDEAIRRTEFTDAPKISHQPNPQLILDAWDKFEQHKINNDRLDQDSFNKKYGGPKNKGIVPPRKEDMGATYLRVKANATAENAIDLLNKVGADVEAGSRYRQQIVGNTSRFLDFASGALSNYLLDPDKWTPPAKLKDFVGKKSRLKVEEEESDDEVITFTDEEIIELIDSLPVDHKQKSHADAAKRWRFALQLLAAYGCRPIELLNLKIKDGELWSGRVKRSGGGYSRARELTAFHPEWGESWRLVERFKAGEELPKSKKDLGGVLNGYLEGKKYWEKLRKEKNVSSYSFRHSYSKRLHLEYGMDNKSASDLMGHTEEVHIKNYKNKWGNNRESIKEKAMLYRDFYEKKNKK